MKKIAMFLIALCLAATAVGAAEFPDMPNDWSTEALNAAVENGLISGSNGYICPDDNLTRAEMAAVMVRAFGAKEKADISAFTDVNPNEWYCDSLAIAVQMGLFNGDGDRLNPDAPILREEAFVVIARALSLDNANTAVLESYIDGASVSDWARGSVAAMLISHYINGSGDYIEPQNNITRAEFAQVMHNIFASYIKAPGTYRDDIEGSVILSSDGITLENCKIAGDVIVGDGVTLGAALNNVEVLGRIIFRGGSANTMKNISNNNIRMPSAGVVVNHDLYGAMTGGAEFDMTRYIAAVYPGGFVYDDGVLSLADEPIMTYGEMSVPFDAFRYYYRASLSQYDGGNPTVWASVKAEIPDDYKGLADTLKQAVSMTVLRQYFVCPILVAEYEPDIDAIYAQSQSDIEQLAEIYAQYGIDMSEYLVQMGISEQTLLDLQVSTYILNAIVEKFAPEVSDEDIDALIAEKGYMRAQHILVEDEETAAEVLAALEDGADFMELVAEYNTDPGMTNVGEAGYFFCDGEMVEPFEAACKQLAEGEISEAVKTDYGYHIIRRLEITDENRLSIALSVAQGAVNELIEQYAAQIIDNVEYSQLYEIIEPANLY